jgi:BirA family biotin operon repressor/biotin-[acetyl-CoA-carboxylase] ligase
MNASRALAVSMAMVVPGEERPVSLMAGVAAVRAMSGVGLKWPNDLVVGSEKVGGILVERSDSGLVVGLGVNLWWPEPPDGIGAVYPEDPGENHHAELGALWAAELMRLIDGEGWPRQEYRASCSTLGREITWEPAGVGFAEDIGDDGSLIVETVEGRRNLHSGAVTHIRG